MLVLSPATRASSVYLPSAKGGSDMEVIPGMSAVQPAGEVTEVLLDTSLYSIAAATATAGTSWNDRCPVVATACGGCRRVTDRMSEGVGASKLPLLKLLETVVIHRPSSRA